MKQKTHKTVNIGIVCSPWLGGSGVIGSELAKFLAKNKKYKVVFIGSELPFRVTNNDIIFKKVSTVNHALFNNSLSEVALVEGIVEAVLEHQLDIIHAHFAIPFASSALQARDILNKMGINIKIITTLHGTDVLFLGKEVPATMKYVIEQSDIVTAVSIDLALKAKKIYNTNKNIHVIYNFIDFQFFNENIINTALVRKKFAKPEEKVFIHISNFRPIKRINDTLEVFFKVRKNLPSVLLLVGEGPEIDVAKKMCKFRKNSEFVHFVGRVKNPYRYLQIADALLVTSEYESFCLVGLEAMAYGVPVFSTRVGGIPEVIKHKKSGYLAPLGDTNKLAGYMIEHFSQSKRIENVKRDAWQRSIDFSAEKIVKNYEQLYTQLTLNNLDLPLESVL